MNELMQKIAEKLSVSIDKIPEVYEGLKWQYVFWETCYSISWVFAIIAFFATPFFIVLMFNWITTDWEWQKESDRLKYKKLLKISTWILISCISIIVFLQILKYVFAPDIIFLKGVLN
jgi:hypothetical protein